jgi:hypothetical protein
MALDPNQPIIPNELRDSDFIKGDADISLNLDRTVLGTGPTGQLTVVSIPPGLIPPAGDGATLTAHGFDGEAEPPTFTSTLSNGVQVSAGMPGVVTEAAIRRGGVSIRSAFGSIIRVEIGQ